MATAAVSMPGGFASELENLFYQRTRVCLWLGVIFFSLFSLLDYICWREHFLLFWSYRLSLVIVYLIMLGMLGRPKFRPYAPAIMFAALLLGALALVTYFPGISLWMVHALGS